MRAISPLRSKRKGPSSFCGRKTPPISSRLDVYKRQEVISAIIADEAAIGMVNSKTTAVRLIPAIGKTAGDELNFGGLLGLSLIHI